MFKVEVRGFKTKEQAQVFVNWYLDSGEANVQDFLAKYPNANYPFSVCAVDCTTLPFKWEDDTLPMVLNVC